MRILHLIIDHQVIERMLGIFETYFPGCNDVIIFSENKNYKHLSRYASCLNINKRNLKIEGERFNFSSYNYIVAHYLTLEMIDFIGYAPKNIHVSWEIYGYDLYNQFLEPLGYKILSPITEKTISRRILLLKRVKLYGLFYFVRTGRTHKFKPVIKKYFIKICNRLNSIEVGCIGDAEILEKYSHKKYVIYRAFNYSLKETLGDLYGQRFFDNNDILIGNSASLSNNHLYVLELISKFKLGASSIIMPLSYGGNADYKELVIMNFHEVFHERMVFLLNYMPLNEYNNIFLRLKAMILSSWRQESIGTIVMGLYLGIKVFMSSKSPLYQSLKAEGFFVFELEEISEKELNEPLLLEQKIYNRRLLLDLYDEKVFEKELRRQFV